MTQIKIPDLGGSDGVQVIEVLVSVGDEIELDQPLLTLEGDKATMEVPASSAGTVKSIHISVGDKVNMGDLCLELDKVSSEIEDRSPSEVNQDIIIPDLGGASDVSVIEVLVSEGDKVEEDQALITLEGDKATMEVPSPFKGEIVKINIKVGDKVNVGDVLASALIVTEKKHSAEKVESLGSEVNNEKIAKKIDNILKDPSNDMVYASPSVRSYATYYGVDLTRVKGSGSNNRILREDVAAAIISLVAQAQSGSVINTVAPKINLDKLGAVEEIELSKIKQVSGKFLTASWQSIPHVTQQDLADITDLEKYRSDLKSKNIKVSPLIFMMKAVAKVLADHPNFNSSLSDDGKKLYIKKQINIGVAVDTPKGLVVPVIRDVNEKNLVDLTKEVVAIAEKARTKGLAPFDMQSGGFTISSLGGIGGGHFTPIVNAPEVAILGVSKLTTQPIWQNDAWQPRKCLPLSLSYDHRVIDGAEGARFITDLVSCLQDPSNNCFLLEK